MDHPTDDRADDPAAACISEREALFDALAAIVDGDGVAAATPEGVARRAGLPPEAFGYHFSSVRDCLLSMYDDALGGLTDSVDRAVAESAGADGEWSGWRARLEAGFGAALDFIAGDPARARACVVEAPSVAPEARSLRDAMLERYIGHLEGLRLAHGEPVPPLAPEMIVRGTHDLVHARVARGETARLRELLPDLRYVWLVPFVGRHRASTARGPSEPAGEA